MEAARDSVKKAGTTVPAGSGEASLRVAARSSRAAAAATDLSLEARRYQHLSRSQALVLSSLAGFLDQPTLTQGLYALVNELKNRFGCSRIAMALGRPEKLRLEAISEQAAIDRRTVDSRSLTNAMQEACEQDCVIHFPALMPPLQILQAHQTLAADKEQLEICTIPLCHDGEVIGALLLERTSQHHWSPLTRGLFEQISSILAPIIVARRDAEAPLSTRLLQAPAKGLGRLFGSSHLALKICAIAVLSTLTFAHFIIATHNVSADGELIAQERRLISAPILGYISEVAVKPGDEVQADDLLLRLDTQDLELELERWRNELLTADSEVRAAMASYDRKEMAVSQARQRQARARMALAEQQLERATIRAPSAGVIVSGDLGQSLGSPVERGDALLELAPSTGYQVQLLVDERDVGYISAGQQGTLSLRASPADGAAFTITNIHPLAESGEGRNRFRVDAELEQDLRGLRPGQTGIGKIEVGEQRLLWLWTHRFVDWLRLRWWELFG